MNDNVADSGGDSDRNSKDLKKYGNWNYIPEPVLLQIFQYLTVRDLLNAGLTCKHWLGISYDDFLWRDIVYSQFQIDCNVKLPPGKCSWREEYKRLTYHIPLVQTEVLKDYTDQVLYVNFSHNGKFFATCSKDGYVVVWDSGYPARIKYSEDMRKHSCWSLTHFCQFNESDIFLLVSGIKICTPLGTSQEIAVFSLQDGFNLQYIIANNPYDIIGTWFSHHYLVYSCLYPCLSPPSTTTTSELFLNKACQETNSTKPNFNKFCRVAAFTQTNISFILIANPPSSKEPSHEWQGDTENVLEEFQPSNADSSEVNEGGNDKDTGVVLNSSTRTSKYYCCEKKACQDLTDINVEKLLISICSSKTYIPHQLGFYKINPVTLLKARDHDSKKMFPERSKEKNSRPDESTQFQNIYKKPDHLIDLEGHIIGMGVSPDHRFLYVNSRPWPQNFIINDPLIPPPIAQEIDIHVIDLVTFKEVGTVLRAHKAYTPSSECLFLPLSVSRDYVASGAEDRHGYLWDRHYGICLAKYAHTNVVNSVAFNPRDSEMLVTTSNDCTIKIWRSRHRVKEMKIENENVLPRGVEMRLKPKKKRRF